jgi:hypothetical protein
MRVKAKKTDNFDLQGWAERLEKGDRQDGTLELAARLQEAFITDQEAPLKFKAELKGRLLEQSAGNQNERSPFGIIRQWLSYTAGLAILVMVLIVSQRAIVNRDFTGQEGLPLWVDFPVCPQIVDQDDIDQKPEQKSSLFMFSSELPHVQQVALADLNGNGYLDAYLAVGTYPYPDFILYNDGNGCFIEPLQLANLPSASVALGDLTGNGIADIVLDITAGALVRHENDGQSVGSAIFLNNPGPIGVMRFTPVLGDLSGDGYLDIFGAGCCGREANMSRPPLHENLLSYSRVWFNLEGRGLSGFSRGEQLIGQLGSHAAALADLNGNGHLDVFLANGHTMDIDGNYQANTPNTVWFNDGQGQFRDSGQQLGQAESTAVALGDLNGNGYPDAVVGNRGPDEVWLNDGQGTFHDSGQRLGNGWTKFVYLADLNGNGHLDLVTSGETESRIWFNDGTGKFTPSQQKIEYKVFDALTVGDLDNNGSIDLLLAGVDYYQVWWNDGSGNFIAGERIRYR